MRSRLRRSLPFFAAVAWLAVGCTSDRAAVGTTPTPKVDAPSAIPLADAAVTADAAPTPPRPDAGRPLPPRPDARLPDTQRPDARVPDARIPDARLPDARLPDAGPRRTWKLLAIGGGSTTSAMVRKFMDMAGGRSAEIVAIPTAGTSSTYSQNWSGAVLWRRAGAKKVTVLHTRSASVANTTAFVKPLTTATGVWFGGGRQWRLVDSYRGTKTHQEMVKLLNRGGVVGGSSAGASILASFLVRGDPRGSHIVVARAGYTEGLSFLTPLAIDQHLSARGRENDLVPVIKMFPKLLGIGLDESTAIAVEGDTFTVIGRARVAIYDIGYKPPAGSPPYYWLSNGHRFDMRTRRKLP